MGGSTSGSGGYFSSSSGIGCRGFSTSGRGGQFQSNQHIPLEAVTLNSNSNALYTLLNLVRNTTGKASNGIGGVIKYQIENSGGSTQDAAHLGVELTNATNSEDTSDFIIQLRNAGAALAEKLRLTGAGQLQVPEARIGTSTDNITIDSDGHMTFNGAATVWDDVRVPANNLTTAGSNDPSKVNWKGNLITWAFDQSKMNQLFFEVQIPHGYKEGSDIYPHIHWRPLASAASATRVRWGLEYVWQNVGEEAPTNTTTIYTTKVMPSENLIGYKHYLSAFNAITGKGKEISSCLSCRIFRDAANAADDFAGDAGLIEIDFHIEMDTIGSNEEYVK